jgi:hypothetical protein
VVRTGSPEFRVGIGDGEVEDAAALGPGLDPDPAAVPLDDALADREAHPGARVLVVTVETTEQAEDLLAVGRVDTDAVVGY